MEYGVDVSRGAADEERALGVMAAGTALAKAAAGHFGPDGRPSFEEIAGRRVPGWRGSVKATADGLARVEELDGLDAILQAGALLGGKESLAHGALPDVSGKDHARGIEDGADEAIRALGEGRVVAARDAFARVRAHAEAGRIDPWPDVVAAIERGRPVVPPAPATLPAKPPKSGNPVRI